MLAQGLAGYKKALLAGKTPTPAQAKAFETASPDQQAKLLQEVEAQKAKVVEPEAPAQKAVVDPHTQPAEIDTASLVQTGPQGGSNPGGVFTDTSTGSTWYIKFPDAEDALRNEALANALYRLAGVEVPEVRLIQFRGRTAIASRVIDGLAIDRKALTSGRVAGVQEHFGVDAWLANWDVIGPDYANTKLGGGRGLRLDPGGALRYRAQGGLKGSAFGDEVGELQSMRHAGTNSHAASVFRFATEADIEDGVRRVLAIPEAEIRRAVEEFGPLDRLEREKLLRTLLARREDLARRYPNARPVAPAAVPTDRVTDLEQREIEASRANGYAFVTDKDAIEDHNVVVSTYTDAKGNAKTRVALKLRPEAAARLRNSANPSGDPGEIDLQPARAKLSELVRGINALADKGEAIRDKDLARLGELRDLVKKARAEATAKAKMLPPDGPAGLVEAEALLEYVERYFRVVGGVGTKAIKIPPVDFDKIVNVPLIAPAGKKASAWRLVRSLRYSTAKIQRGRIVETDGQASVSGVGEVLRGKFKGAEATFVPDTSGNVVTMRGYLQIDLDGAGKDITAQAFDLLEELGIPAARATEAARLELYLDRHIYIRAVRDPKIESRWQALAAEADEAARIEKKLALLKEISGVDVQRSRYWDPQGSRQAFSHGRVLMQRADFDDAELEQFKREHVFFHNPVHLGWDGGSGVLDRFKLLVESGGQLASQADRVRRGVALGGSSVGADLRTGGANYIFTRISKRSGGYAGRQKGAGFYFKPEIVQRSDAISYSGDRFGDISLQQQRSDRAVTLKEIAGYARSSGNETILRDSVSLFDAVEYIALSTQAQVTEAIAFMRAQGYTTWPDGRALEAVIIPTSKLPYAP